MDWFDGVTIIFDGGPVGGQFLEELRRTPQHSVIPLKNKAILKKAATSNDGQFLPLVLDHDRDIIFYQGDSIEEFLQGVIEVQAYFKVLVVIDELCKMTTLHNIPKPLLSIADAGRHCMLDSNGQKTVGKGVSLLVGFRRSQAIHKGLFNQLKRIYLHRISAKKDVAAVADIINEDLQPSDTASLEIGHFLQYDEGNLTEDISYWCAWTENMRSEFQPKEVGDAENLNRQKEESEDVLYDEE